MKTRAILAASAAAAVALTPVSAAADAKDAIVGGIIGGILGGAIQNQQSKSKQQKNARKTPARQAAPTLNSQYSKSERIQIQASLRDQGYPIGTVDGILGKNSRAAIRMFQGSRGEAQTGQLTAAQFASLTGLGGNQFGQPQFANRTLAPNEVAMMQQSLQRLGFYRGRVDGINGPGTQTAAAAFLASQGMSPVGLTNVQILVSVASAAGMVAPPYLVQEANGSSGFGAPQQQPFGTPQTQQAFGQQPQQQQPFGTPQTQQAFGQQPQQQQLFGAPQTNQAFGQQPQQQLFGTPQTQQAFGQQPSQQQQFGTPQTQQAFGQQPQQQPFGAPQTQQTFGQQTGTSPGVQPAPQGQQPLFQQPGQTVPQQQGGQGTPLFASGNPAGQMQPQTQPVGAQGQPPLFPQQAGGQQAVLPVPQQQQPQSTLDVYSPTSEASGNLQPQSAFGNTNN